ncbi:hypothetical protein AB0E56_02085 [Microbacterium sp. NPDC028030]|uniref:hypothetical protein n=1 Tax=Microbacterium sp. NPDC028030 TaxID=3155124 RepID=UPI0033D8F147
MDEDRENLLMRKEIIDGYIAALENPQELLRVCARGSGDSDELRAAVGRAFGVSEVAADAILSLQVRRFTPRVLAQFKDESADYERRLSAGPS